MTTDPKQFAKDLFRAAQSPAGWFLSAERLRDAAEIILHYEAAQEIPYFQAHDEAVKQAMADACRDGHDAGVAEVAALPPNYPPAQLLYAYAIENVLKGLIVANLPGLIDEQRLNRELQTHNLIKLAGKAGFTVHVQETSILGALSTLSVWAGRYPVARTRKDYVGTQHADAMLDYGSAHPVMRAVFGP